MAEERRRFPSFRGLAKAASHEGNAVYIYGAPRDSCMGPLTLLPVFGLALLLERRWRFSSGAALLHAVAWIIIVLYCGGLLGTLWWTALAVHLLGIVALGFELMQRARSPGPFSLPTPYVVLLVLAGLFWFVHGNNQYLYYDEYAHWGIFLKEMLAFDDFWRADTNAMHPRYPPGSTLWQYLFNAFQEPTEGKTYLGQFVLLSAPLMVLWDRLTLRQWPWGLGIAALCVLVVMNFGFGVSSLYVDHVIAAWFIGTVLCYLSDVEQSSRRTASYAAPLIVLTLVKDAGLAFALSAAAIIATLMLARVWTQSRSTRLSFFAALTALVMLVAPAIVVAQSWSWNRDRAGSVHDVQSVDGMVDGLLRGASKGDLVTDQEIKRRFVEVFSNQQISNDRVSWQFNAFSYPLQGLFTDSYRLTTLSLLCAFALWWLGLFLIFLRGPDKWRWCIVASGVFATSAAYVVMLYLSYRFAFGDRGLELSSYTRYIHTIALPMVLVSFAPLLPAFRSSERGRLVHLRGVNVSASAAIFCSALSALIMFEPPYLRPLLEPAPRAVLRDQFEPVATEVRRAAGSAPIWIYLPQDQPNQFTGRLLQFLLSPTPATVERSAMFLDQDFDSAIAQWSRFEYVWIPVRLQPDAAQSLSRFVPGNPVAGLFRVRRDSAAGHALEPVAAVTTPNESSSEAR